MPKFRIRYNKEYVLDIEANSKDEAFGIADHIEEEMWDATASPWEIEEISDE